MDFGWHGEKTRLVPLDFDRHFENCYRWMNDPVVTEFLCVGDHPITRIAEKEWFENRFKDTSRDVVFAVETLDGKHIGTSGLHGIDRTNGTATTGTLIGEKSVWGQGYGSDSVLVRTGYAFEVLGLRMLLSSYLGGNVASAKMQARAGYMQYGIIPERRWKRGAFRDEIFTYCTRESWQRAIKAGP